MSSFPNLTNLFSVSDAYKPDVLDNLGLNKSSYWEGNFFGNTRNTSGRTIFENVTHDIGDLLDSFVVRTRSARGKF